MKPHNTKLSNLGLNIDLSCSRCKQLLEVFLDFEDISTHDLYDHFEGEMTHSTVDKHINHLISDKLVYRMLDEKTPSKNHRKKAHKKAVNMLELDIISLFHRISKGGKSMLDLDSDFTKEVFANALTILRENLRTKCPECGFEHVMPIFSLEIAESFEESDKTEAGRVKTDVSGKMSYQCTECHHRFLHSI